MADIARGQTMRISPEGRVVIPVDVRKALGVGPGDDLIAWLEGNRLIMTTRRAVEEELWAMFADIEDSLADELIEERRQEARRESIE